MVMFYVFLVSLAWGSLIACMNVINEPDTTTIVCNLPRGTVLDLPPDCRLVPLSCRRRYLSHPGEITGINMMLYFTCHCSLKTHLKNSLICIAPFRGNKEINNVKSKQKKAITTLFLVGIGGLQKIYFLLFTTIMP